MILIVVLSSWVVFGLICYFATLPQKSLPVVPRPKSHLGIHDGYVSPNQKQIDALEATMPDVFGIDKEISGLPGYKWKIKQGISYTNDAFQVIYDPHGIEICLMNSMSGQAASKMLSSKRKTDSYNSRRPTYINRTVAEMDTRAQELMKEMVVKEISVREFAEGLKGIIKKYNGKPVE